MNDANAAPNPSSSKKISRNKFSEQDDALLRKLVAEYGTNNWGLLALKMPNRNARQLRERWNNYVRPNLSISPWTPEENSLLLEKFQEYGKKWHTIAQFFPNRSTNNIKYHLQAMLYPKKKTSTKPIAPKIPVHISPSPIKEIAPFTIAQLLN